MLRTRPNSSVRFAAFAPGSDRIAFEFRVESTLDTLCRRQTRVELEIFLTYIQAAHLTHPPYYPLLLLPGGYATRFENDEN